MVTMPPVPSDVPLPPARASISGVIPSTTGMNFASALPRGSAVYSPSMSESSTSRSACTVAATMAERVSLSPMTISSVAMVSFSLMTGSAPSSSSRYRVLWKWARRVSSSTSLPVTSSWATVWLYSENSRS